MKTLKLACLALLGTACALGVVVAVYSLNREPEPEEPPQETVLKVDLDIIPVPPPPNLGPLPRLSHGNVADVSTEALPPSYSYWACVSLDGMTLAAVTGPSSNTDYLTLDEAMDLGECKVCEVAGGRVNQLSIISRSSRPIFAMAGDLLLGGKQDRVLAESIVVAPQESVLAPVFCVEQGRWCPDERDGEKATRGEFYKDGMKGQADLKVRKAAVESRSQAQVWEQVEAANESLGTQGVKSSGTFRNNYDSAAVATKINENFLRAQFLRSPLTVGFVVIVEGRIVAIDVFDSAALCAKLADKLLRGYIITGLSGGYSAEVLARERRALPAEPEMRPQEQVEYPVDDCVDEHNEDPSDRPNRSLAEGSRGRLAGREYPRPASAVGLGGGSGGGGARQLGRSESTRTYGRDALRYECKDKATGRTVHISLLRR